MNWSYFFFNRNEVFMWNCNTDFTYYISTTLETESEHIEYTPYTRPLIIMGCLVIILGTKGLKDVMAPEFSLSMLFAPRWTNFLWLLTFWFGLP
jgi:hypothetical protein